MKDLIKKVCNIEGVSGREKTAALVIKELIEPYADEVYFDKFYNIIARKNSKNKNAKTIMLDAHIDQIGFMVTNITKDGFLKFTSVGGVDPRMLLSTDVFVHTKDKKLRGIVCCAPPHTTTDASKAKTIPDMLIDIGMNEENARKYVKVGTIITFAEEVYHISDQTVTGKCLDDRAGIASIIRTFEMIQNEDLDLNVLAVFSGNEEVHGTGSMVASYNERPDFAIAIDVGHAKTPDASPEKCYDFGQVLIGMGPNVHKKTTKGLIKTCEKHEIKFDLEVMEGCTGTNAWYIQVSRTGIPVAILSIPLKYMHTPIETVLLADIENTAKLVAEFIKDYKEEQNA